MRDFRKLLVWQRSRTLVSNIYRLSRQFPSDERFGLVSQMRRAAISITADLAEGAGRSSAADYARFVDMAAGSANELESLLIVAQDLGFVSEPAAKAPTVLIAEIRSMCSALAATLRS